MNDMQGEFKVVDRRVAHNESVLNEQGKLIEQHTEKLETYRKRFQRLDNQLMNLQRNTSSALESVAEKQSQNQLSVEDIANLEISGEGMEHMTKMVQRVEKLLGRRISALEGQMSRFNEIEDMVEQLKTQGVTNNAPVKPCGFEELNITQDDLIKWHEAHERSEEHQELIKQVQIELAMLDTTKVKNDISSLIKAGQTYMTKESVARMTEDVKKIRIEIADNGYEV